MMKEKQILTIEELIELILNDEKLLEHCTLLLGCSKKSLRQRLLNQNVDIRTLDVLLETSGYCVKYSKL